MKRPGLIGDERGATAIYVALSMGALIGTAGLAIDLGRAMTLASELQHAADAAALAGAVELDGEDGARDRARAAALGGYGTNVQTFATDGSGSAVQVGDVTFLASLSPDTAANNDSEARFIQVQMTPRDAAPLLMPVLGDSDAISLSATATAGFQRVACNIPPLMICNPTEPAGAGSETPFEAGPGQQILIKKQGAGSQWAPGTFGLLDPPSGNQGAQQVAGWLARGVSPGCYGATVSVRPGQADAVRTALNTRFDMYENPFFGGGNDKRNPDYRPAVNVTKGRVPVGGNACNTAPPATPADAMGLPRDTCLQAGTCGRVGDGSWDRTGYWTVNHGIAPPAGTTTRYQTYRWEIDNNRIPDADQTTGTTRESGNARLAPPNRCYAGPTAPNDAPDRRVLYFAVVNCGLHDIHGNADNIPVIAYVEAFLTEPATTDSNVYLEVIQVARPETTSSVMHDLIQLYR